VNWKQNKDLAIALRNQAFADCFAARFALRPGSHAILGVKCSFAHLVVAKSQQCVEKITKGFLLWHSKSFDPTKGHTPLANDSSLTKNQQERLDLLFIRLNRINSRVVSELKWLESLAPRPPQVPNELRGKMLDLSIIEENTEYPFWSEAKSRLATPAEGISMTLHGVRAIKCLRTYLTALSQSDPVAFTGDIHKFLESSPFSTSVVEWVPDVG